MKKKVCLVCVLLICSFTILAQEKSINNRVGCGLQLSQIQRDFGFGLNITSPYFAKTRMALRLKGAWMFNENVQNLITKWSPYTHVSLGLIGRSGQIGEYIRLYGEGGIITLFPSNEFSSEQFVLGGYGCFGFEFYMNNNSNYFIEIGGVGTGAIADKIAFRPIYSNGLLLSTGFRMTFK